MLRLCRSMKKNIFSFCWFVWGDLLFVFFTVGAGVVGYPQSKTKNQSKTHFIQKELKRDYKPTYKYKSIKPQLTDRHRGAHLLRSALFM